MEQDNETFADRKQSRNRVNKKQNIVAVALGILVFSLSGCGALEQTQSQTATNQSASTGQADNNTFFNTENIHTIDVAFEDADYQQMLSTYAETGDKEWIEADVTIDGTLIENVGLRLKGNSSLRGLGGTQTAVVDEGDGTADSNSPEGLPWLIRLDKYVDDQSYSGRVDFVVRGNNTETSLNEAVALAMLAEAGVTAQQAAFTAFSVNGSSPSLRLVVDSPDDELWNAEIFGGGNTYKADSEGDYSYRGSDATSYLDVFTQRTGVEDMTPVIEFLDFINNSSDEEFAQDLSQHLDTEGFATYLAAQDLIRNNDAIDGMGNNSYLHFDSNTNTMSIVAWDHNLAFAAMGADGGPGGGFQPDTQQSGTMPDFAQSMGGDFPDPGQSRPQGGPPADGQREMPMSGQAGAEAGRPPQDAGGFGGQRGPGAKSNPLVTRFLGTEEFAQLYGDALESLNERLIASGFAEQILDNYVDLLSSEGQNLVSQSAIENDADAIRQQLASEVTSRV